MLLQNALIFWKTVLRECLVCAARWAGKRNPLEFIRTALSETKGFFAQLIKFYLLVKLPTLWHDCCLCYSMISKLEYKMKHPVDAHVGKRIRHRRWMVGMTQQQLADKVGIKFQQIQKYETGMNRVSASRLWDIADTLGVGISFFFEGLSADGATSATPAGDMLADKEALELVRSYYAIPEAQRRRLFDLARVLSDVA
jgi:transcriptional regulator with XRE-family HTH domain